MKFIRKPFQYRYFQATLFIVGINVSLYFLFQMFPLLSRYLALNPLRVIKGYYITQIFTYQFVHTEFSHLFFNMLGLLIFGLPVEKKMGSTEFLLFYLLNGTLCGLFSCIIYYYCVSPFILLMGASGSIFSILLAFAVLFPSSIIFIWGIIPIPAPILVLVYTLLEVFNILFTTSNVAHLTHLLGFLFAWIYIRVRFGIKPSQVCNLRS